MTNEVERAVDWTSALSWVPRCEGVHTVDGVPDETWHPADYYVRSRCSKCDRTQVKAVCTEYKEYLLSPRRKKMTQCRACEGLTPNTEFYTVVGWISRG